MNTARILSTATLAAVAAFASVGAYAAPAAGEFSAVADDAGFQSTRTRAEVVAEGAQAVANFKNFYVAPQAEEPVTVLTRAHVRAEGRLAIRSHELATGNLG
jgi:hypothetical protein